jgi:hypothetical protein
MFLPFIIQAEIQRKNLEDNYTTVVAGAFLH